MSLQCFVFGTSYHNILYQNGDMFVYDPNGIFNSQEKNSLNSYLNSGSRLKSNFYPCKNYGNKPYEVVLAVLENAVVTSDVGSIERLGDMALRNSKLGMPCENAVLILIALNHRSITISARKEAARVLGYNDRNQIIDGMINYMKEGSEKSIYHACLYGVKETTEKLIRNANNNARNRNNNYVVYESYENMEPDNSFWYTIFWIIFIIILIILICKCCDVCYTGHLHYSRPIYYYAPYNPLRIVEPWIYPEFVYTNPVRPVRRFVTDSRPEVNEPVISSVTKTYSAPQYDEPVSHSSTRSYPDLGFDSITKYFSGGDSNSSCKNRSSSDNTEIYSSSKKW